MKVSEIVLTAVTLAALLTIKHSGSYQVLVGSFLSVCFVVSLLFLREVKNDVKILVTLSVTACGQMASILSPDYGIFFTSVSAIMGWVITIVTTKTN